MTGSTTYCEQFHISWIGARFRGLKSETLTNTTGPSLTLWTLKTRVWLISVLNMVSLHRTVYCLSCIQNYIC